MKVVARQSQLLSHINELALSLRRPARDVVVPFFRRIAEPEHGRAFDDAVSVRHAACITCRGRALGETARMRS